MHSTRFSSHCFSWNWKPFPSPFYLLSYAGGLSFFLLRTEPRSVLPLNPCSDDAETKGQRGQDCGGCLGVFTITAGLYLRRLVCRGNRQEWRKGVDSFLTPFQQRGKTGLQEKERKRPGNLEGMLGSMYISSDWNPL